MATEKITVKRDDLATTQRESTEPATLADGQVRLAVELIGLSANNVSYAAAGDMLGYWAHFSTDDTWGVVPVWGFSVVTESRHPAIAQGERIFGFLPMASDVVMTPESVTDLTFADATGARANMHPWYTRCYRCQQDPAFDADLMEEQPVLWALFMTGWMMAEELTSSVDTVYVSSASSKTAISVAWALRHAEGNATTVGVTSAGNRAFVEALDVYDRVVTYDDIGSEAASGRAAYVDIAGNAAVTSAIHVTLGDALQDSVLIGGTHRKPATSPLPMPGPSPRFFFIPDVAEARAGKLTFDAYHQQFAGALIQFEQWAKTWLDVERGIGASAVESGYLANVAGGIPPQRAMVFRWQ